MWVTRHYFNLILDKILIVFVYESMSRSRASMNWSIGLTSGCLDLQELTKFFTSTTVITTLATNIAFWKTVTELVARSFSGDLINISCSALVRAPKTLATCEGGMCTVILPAKFCPIWTTPASLLWMLPSLTDSAIVYAALPKLKPSLHVEPNSFR